MAYCSVSSAPVRVKVKLGEAMPSFSSMLTGPATVKCVSSPVIVPS